MLAFLGIPTAVSAIASFFVGATGGVYALYRSSPLSRSRRRALRTAKKVEKKSRQARSLVERFRDRIRKSVGKYEDYRRQKQRLEAPVTELRGLVSQVKWSALDEAGIETLGDLEKTTEQQLIELDGIGPKTAQALKEKANVLAGRLEQQPLPPPEVSLTEPGARDLARDVLGLQTLRQELGDVPARLQRATRELDHQARSVKKNTGFWAWVRTWRNPEARAAAREEADRLDETARNVIGSGVLEEFDTRRSKALKAAAENHSPAHLAREYQKEYATVSSTIDEAMRETLPTDRDRPEIGSFGRTGLTNETLESIQSTALHSDTMSIGLRRYQEFGTRFVLAQERTVLGDEMGLGKTVQALAAMAQLWAQHGLAHFVVVAPAGILLNWRKEVEEKSFLRARLAHGSDKVQTVDDWLSSGGVLVTSYATLRTFDLSERVEGNETTLDLLVADEAHYVKNPDSQRSQALARLVQLSDRVCLMTGTPMENHPREFARLIDMIRPGELTLSDEELERAHSGDVSSRFQRDVAGVYLRRNQDDVLQELPERIEFEDWVTLQAEQERGYHEAVESGNFMKMRQLVTVGDEDSSKKDLGSAKLERLLEILEDHREAGRKVLVFSFFLDVLKQVGSVVPNVGTIRGSVSQDKREAMIEAFRDEPGHQVLLAQITAAGHGLNLQMASAVILMEPQLTPGAEAQAIARAHRMGQTQKVLVHRLLAAHTVDERLMEILQEKGELFDDYARQSLAKDRNPEATETQVIRKIIQLEQERLGAGAAKAPADEPRDETS